MIDEADDGSSILCRSEQRLSEYKIEDEELSIDEIVYKRKEMKNFKNSFRKSKEDVVPYSRRCAAPFSPSKAHSNDSIDGISDSKSQRQS